MDCQVAATTGDYVDVSALELSNVMKKDFSTETSSQNGIPLVIKFGEKGR